MKGRRCTSIATKKCEYDDNDDDDDDEEEEEEKKHEEVGESLPSFCDVRCTAPRNEVLSIISSELETELIQPHMTQKPMLRGEVGARAWLVFGQTREEVWASAGGARRLGESACVVRPIKARLWLRDQLPLLCYSPVGIVQGATWLRLILLPCTCAHLLRCALI